MFCRKCYTELDGAVESRRCPKCRREFDPSDRGSYLLRPFPDTKKIIIQIIGTTIVGFIVAWIVSFFQIAGSSGH